MAAIGRRSTGRWAENQVKQAGFALVFVLLVTSVIILYVLEFNFNSRVELQLAEYRLNRLKAYEINRSALNFVEAALFTDIDRKMDHLGEDWAQIGYYSQLFGVVFPGAKVNIVVEDESGKFNVNRLLIPKKKEKELKLDTWLDERLRTMGDNLFSESGFVDAIIDWIDLDDDDYFHPQASDSGGAEDSFYQGLKHPYPAKDSYFDALAELILVKGINEVVYYGEGGAESPGLRDLLTIYSDGKINVNTAPKQVMLSLHPMLNEALVEEILKQRVNDPFITVASFLSFLREKGIKFEGKDPLTRSLSIKSSGAFKVEIAVSYQGVDANMEAVLQRYRNNTEIIYSRIRG